MKTTKTITPAMHNEFSKGHSYFLDYLFTLEAENGGFEDLSEFEWELSFGLEYLGVSNDSSCYRILKRVDEFACHLRYAKEVNSPLEKGDLVMRCFIFATMYVLSLRIPNSRFQNIENDVIISTPMFSAFNTSTPLVYTSTISAILNSGESVADFSLKLLSFNMPDFGILDTPSTFDEDWLMDVTMHQQKILEGVVLFDKLFDRRSVGALLDLVELTSRNPDLDEKHKLSQELAVLYGNYLVSEFKGRWVYFEGGWRILINERILCNPFYTVKSNISDPEAGNIYSELCNIKTSVS
jgi:hypothetical protein